MTYVLGEIGEKEAAVEIETGDGARLALHADCKKADGGKQWGHGRTDEEKEWREGRDR